MRIDSSNESNWAAWRRAASPSTPAASESAAMTASLSFRVMLPRSGALCRSITKSSGAAEASGMPAGGPGEWAGGQAGGRRRVGERADRLACRQPLTAHHGGELLGTTRSSRRRSTGVGLRQSHYCRRRRCRRSLGSSTTTSLSTSGIRLLDRGRVVGRRGEGRRGGGQGGVGQQGDRWQAIWRPGPLPSSTCPSHPPP